MRDERVCSCGHYAYRHYTEDIEEKFMGWWGIARTENYTYIRCPDCEEDKGVHNIG
jgi:hypothetical protein